MARWLWVLGARPLTLLGSILLGCVASVDEPVPAGPGFHEGGATGVAGTTGRGGVGPVTGTGGIRIGGERPQQCTPRPSRGLLDKHVVTHVGAVPKVFYSWTTREEVEALRRDQVLFTRAGQAQAGRGYAFTFIEQLAADPTFPWLQTAARLLLNGQFANSRYAWPTPWAIRRGWPGEQVGDQLVRIDLKASAWVARVTRGTIEIVDMDGITVSDADVTRSPERIGAIFFVKDWEAGGPACGDIFALGEDSAGVGYREFILGNEAMVEEWSIATPAMRQRLVDDAAVLTKFLDVIRPCPAFLAPPFNVTATCAWSLVHPDLDGEELAYLNSLALPSEYYGSVGEIAKTIDLLNAGLFEPEPLVVRPGE